MEPPTPSEAVTEAASVAGPRPTQLAVDPVWPRAQPPQVNATSSPSGSLAAAMNVTEHGAEHAVGVAMTVSPPGARFVILTYATVPAMPPWPSDAVTETLPVASMARVGRQATEAESPFHSTGPKPPPHPRSRQYQLAARRQPIEVALAAVQSG